MMKKLGIIVAAVLGLFLLLGLSQMAASESGEVITLTTRAANEEATQTRLWIVEHDGAQWLRAGQAESGWALRIAEDANVTVERAGQSAAYVATATPEKRATINGLLREKYGWADAYIDALFDVSDAVPYRLEPVE